MCPGLQHTGPDSRLSSIQRLQDRNHSEFQVKNPCFHVDPYPCTHRGYILFSEAKRLYEKLDISNSLTYLISDSLFNSHFSLEASEMKKTTKPQT